MQQYLAPYYKGKKPVVELACGIGGDTFESRLEDAIQFVLEEIRKVGRDLGRNAPYKKTPHIRLCHVQIQRGKLGAHELHR